MNILQRIGLLLFAFTVYVSSLSGQILDINPVFPTIDDTITVVYNATEGNAALVGVSPVYAHAGLITSQSTSPTDWKHVQGNWGTADPKVLMTDLGNNQHQIKYHIKTFYSVPNGVTVNELAFVFRSADGGTVGRSADGSDIYYPVYEAGDFHVAILKPTETSVIEANESLDISAAASDSAGLTLEITGNVEAQVDGKSISYSFSNATPGNYHVILIADNGLEVKKDSALIVVRGLVNIQNPAPEIIPGINYIDDSTVTLSLYAPGKDYVYLLGDFNDYQPNADFYMNLSADSSTFWLTINGLTPGEEYGFQYFVDGELRIADPYADKVLDPWNDPWITNDTYPDLKDYPVGLTSGIVSVLQTAQTPYQWQTSTWDRPDPEKMVVYELLVRDFVETHDYQTLIDTLPYLEKLGVNVIELMPIMEFEGNNSWGYNPSFFFAVDKYYGTKNDLKAFIDTCHSRGISVVLDMVLNHAFGLNSLVRLYWDGANNRPSPDNPWFNPEAKHPFNVGYDFNHESQQTKDFVDRVLAYWVEEYRFDGYRMDLSKGFTQTFNTDVGAWSNYDAGRIAILKRMFDELRTVDSSAYFILEHFANNTEEKELAEYGMMLWGNLVHNYNEATMGYVSTSNFNWISYQQRGWSKPHVMGYMESHDEQRLMYKNLQFGNSSGCYSTKTLNTALRRMEQAAAFFFTIPGPKMLWQFGEVGYDVDIDFNGRTGEKPIRWNYLENLNRRNLYDVYSALINLKTEYEAFSTDNYNLSLGGAIKTIKLNHSSMNVAIVGNFEVTQQSGSVGFQQTGWWYDFFKGDSINVTDVNMSFDFEPGEYHLYTDVRLEKPEQTLSVRELLSNGPELKVYPNPFTVSTNIAFELAEASDIEVSVITLNGQYLGKLTDSKFFPAGKHEMNWNGQLENGQIIPSGMYFLNIKTEKGFSIARLVKN
ncbi:MAG: T9SS type A sorting domain-containing protein [Bacteroidetes bacterium]|nr:T9SS type A sorting domain-containing protein [Bacteroidota bacterium]